MNLDAIRYGKITLQVNALSTEKVLNALWRSNINITNVKKIDIATIRFTVLYREYKNAISIIKRLRGKYKIIGISSWLFFILQVRKKLSLAIGFGIFFIVLYMLSNYIWAVDIETQNNLTPFEVRKELTSIRMAPGIRKKDINVYNIEKKMEDIDNRIMWIRVRIEGATLRVVIKEKINPPVIERNLPNEVLAKMDGEVKRVFTVSGNSAVSPGDIVRKGDVLIFPIEGREGFEKEVRPSGTVIANTFYEKFMEVQISGEKLKRTGKKQSDIYLNICNKKFYFKKAIRDYKYYDKIEESIGVLNKIVYFEKKGEKINLDKETVVQQCSKTLRESLEKSLNKDAVIVDSKVEENELSDGKLLVRIIFTVEQNIAENIW